MASNPTGISMDSRQRLQPLLEHWEGEAMITDPFPLFLLLSLQAWQKLASGCLLLSSVRLDASYNYSPGNIISKSSPLLDPSEQGGKRENWFGSLKHVRLTKKVKDCYHFFYHLVKLMYHKSNGLKNQDSVKWVHFPKCNVNQS